MIEFRVKTRRSDKWMAKVAGTPITEDMINIKLEGPAKVLRPDGKPLCVYLPGAALEVTEQTFEEFSRIRGMTNNRGYASGSERKVIPGRSRSYAQPIASSILGSFDPVGPNQFCRLTAFTAKEVERWESLLPYFQRIAELLEANVPDRFAAQVRAAESTNPDWIIPGTPFTTITVNRADPAPERREPHSEAHSVTLAGGNRAGWTPSDGVRQRLAGAAGNARPTKVVIPESRSDIRGPVSSRIGCEKDTGFPPPRE